MSLSELWQIVVQLWQIVVNYPINWVMVFQVIGVGVLIILVIALVSGFGMVWEVLTTGTAQEIADAADISTKALKELNDKTVKELSERREAYEKKSPWGPAG